MRLRTAFLWLMIVSLALAAAIGVVGIIFDNLGSMSERIIFTSLLVSAFSLTALAASIVLDRHRFRTLSWLGIATSMLALAVWLVLVWFDRAIPSNVEDLLVKIGGTLTTLAILSPHIGLLGLLRLDRGANRGVRRATWALTTALALTIVFSIWPEYFEEWNGKLMAVLAILGSCGTAVTPVLAIIERVRRGDSAESVERRVEIDLTCPRCGHDQRVRAGRAKCSQCGLRINIDVEEPRCECGYLLFRLEGDVCPECGRAIEAGGRWSAAVDEP